MAGGNQDSFDALGSFYSVLFDSNNPKSPRYAPQQTLNPITDVAGHIDKVAYEITGGKAVANAWGSLVGSTVFKEHKFKIGAKLLPEKLGSLGSADAVLVKGRTVKRPKLDSNGNVLTDNYGHVIYETDADIWKASSGSGGIASIGLGMSNLSLQTLTLGPGALVDKIWQSKKEAEETQRRYSRFTKGDLLKPDGITLFKAIVGTGVAAQGAGVFAATYARTRRKDLAAFLSETRTGKGKWSKKHDHMIAKGVAFRIEAELRRAGVPESKIKALVHNKSFQKKIITIIQKNQETRKKSLLEFKDADIKALSNSVFTEVMGHLDSNLDRIGLPDEQLKKVKAKLLGKIEKQEGESDEEFNQRKEQIEKENKQMIGGIVSLGVNGAKEGDFSRMAEASLSSHPDSVYKSLAALAGAADGKMNFGEKMQWYHFRYNDLKARAGQSLTFAGFLTGDAFKFMAGANAYTKANGAKFDVGALYKHGGKAEKSFVENFYAPKEYKMCKDAEGKATNEVCKDKDGNPIVLGWKMKHLGLGSYSENATFLPYFGATPFDVLRANKMQKTMFWAYRLHPFQAVKGALDGSLWLDFMAYGTKMGTQPISSSRLARLGSSVLNNRVYRTWLKGVSGIKFVKDLPIIAMDAGVDAGKKLISKSVNKILSSAVGKAAKKLVKKLVNVLISIGLGAVTGGIATAIQFLRKLPIIGSLIDKVLFEAAKLLLIIAWFFLLMIILFIANLDYYIPGGKILTGIKKTYSKIVHHTGASSAFPSQDEPLYVDVDTTGTANPGVTDNTDIPPTAGVPCIVDTGVIVQGPFGTWSHAVCDPSTHTLKSISYATDISGHLKIYAPADGNVSCIPLTVEEIRNPGHYVYIGHRLTLTSGSYAYNFVHVDCLKTGHVNKGDLIAVTSSNLTRSNNWTNEHLHLYVKNNSTGAYANGAEWFLNICPGIPNNSPADYASKSCTP